MSILRRGVPALKEFHERSEDAPITGRRIEVTVKRETVTILVRGDSRGGSWKSSSGERERMVEHLNLPAPVLEFKALVENCPNCGSGKMARVAECFPGLDLTLLRQDSEGGVHLHRSASGEWWICQQSFHGR